MRKHIYLLLFASFLFSCEKLKDYLPNPHETKPLPQFNEVYGGTREDIALFSAASPDGGYLMAGFTNSNDRDVSGNHGETDGWAVKLDKSGQKEWQNTLGGSSYEVFDAVVASPDGGYVMVGGASSNDGDVSGLLGETDAWVVKLDKNGNLVLQKAIGGSRHENCRFIMSTKDGGYLLAGFAASNDGDVSSNYGEDDAWIVKLDGEGDIIWQKTYGGSRSDFARSITESKDGGYVFVCYTNSSDGDVINAHGEEDAWMVKIDKDGNILWKKALGGTGSDYASSITNSPDGGYVAALYTESNDGDVSGNHGEEDAWIVKLDKDGNLKWQKAVGGTGDDMVNFISATKDGGYVLAGRTYSNDGDVSGNHGGLDAWVFKLDKEGSLKWQKALGGTSNDAANFIFERSDGSYVVTGSTESKDGDVNGNTDAWVLTIKDN